MTLKAFVGGRILWDQTMASSAVSDVRSRGGTGQARHAVLVGNDHVKYRYGLQERIRRISSVGGAKPMDVVSMMLNPRPVDTLMGPTGLETPDRLALQMSLPADGAAAIPIADCLVFSNSYPLRSIV